MYAELRTSVINQPQLHAAVMFPAFIHYSSARTDSREITLKRNIKGKIWHLLWALTAQILTLHGDTICLLWTFESMHLARQSPNNNLHNKYFVSCKNIWRFGFYIELIGEFQLMGIKNIKMIVYWAGIMRWCRENRRVQYHYRTNRKFMHTEQSDHKFTQRKLSLLKDKSDNDLIQTTLFDHEFMQTNKFNHNLNRLIMN